MMTTKEKDKLYVAPTYARFDVELVGGKGSVVTDEKGKEYIDMGTGIAVNAFGVADEKWVAAVTEQLNKLQHSSNLYYTAPGASLAEILCERTGMKKVFFGNSGAEANECAIKIARKYGYEKRGAKCYKIITLVNSFHGRTITTLAATGQDKFHTLFLPLTDGFVHVKANDLDELSAAANPDEVAAVLIECVQGEGGVNALTAEFVLGAEKLCRERDILLMVDEVQTGNGRTGALYAYQNFGISPDVVTTAKGLGNGLPIGACMMNERTQYVLGAGEHGSTFGANPVAAAGAISVLERIDDELLTSVRDKSKYVFEALSGAKGIESVSGMGLMIGVKTKRSAKDVVNECMERGVLCLTAKDKVRLLPALNIPFELLQKAINVIKSVAASE